MIAWNKNKTQVDRREILNVTYAMISLYCFYFYTRVYQVCTSCMYIDTVKRSPDVHMYHSTPERTLPIMFPSKILRPTLPTLRIGGTIIWPVVFGKYHISIRDFIVSQIKAAHSILDR